MLTTKPLTLSVWALLTATLLADPLQVQRAEPLDAAAQLESVAAPDRTLDEIAQLLYDGEVKSFSVIC